jgi:hypothetical protein
MGFNVNSSSDLLDENNVRHGSFLNLFPARAREYVRKHYREVLPGVYESDAPPLSYFHQKLARLLVRPLYGVGDRLHRYGLTRCEKHVLKLAYELRAWIWRRHDKRMEKLKSRRS